MHIIVAILMSLLEKCLIWINLFIFFLILIFIITTSTIIIIRCLLSFIFVWVNIWLWRLRMFLMIDISSYVPNRGRHSKGWWMTCWDWILALTLRWESLIHGLLSEWVLGKVTMILLLMHVGRIEVLRLVITVHLLHLLLVLRLMILCFKGSPSILPINSLLFKFFLPINLKLL